MQTINFISEKAQLQNIVLKLWNIADKSQLEYILNIAFHEGLYDGRFYLDEMFQYRMYSELGITGDTLFYDLRAARKEDKTPVCFDALYIFDGFLFKMLERISLSAKHHSPVDINKRAISLAETLKQSVNPAGFAPASLSKAESDDIIANTFSGFLAQGIRDDGTPYRLAPKHVNYWAQEQGHDVFEYLVKLVYFHGIACAEEFNTRECLMALLPVYQTFMTQPTNSENGEEIISALPDCEMIQIALAIEQPTFQTHALRAAEAKAEQQRVAAMTPDEIERENQQANASIDDIFAELDDPEFIALENKQRKGALQFLNSDIVRMYYRPIMANNGIKGNTWTLQHYINTTHTTRKIVRVLKKPRLRSC